MKQDNYMSLLYVYQKRFLQEYAEDIIAEQPNTDQTQLMYFSLIQHFPMLLLVKFGVFLKKGTM